LDNWRINHGVDLFSKMGAACSVKTRYIEDSRIVFRYDDDRKGTDGYPEYEEYAHKHRKRALEAIHFAGGVLLSDYDKGFLTQELIREVVDLCKQRGIPCVADAKREPAVYAGTVLKCNSAYVSKYLNVLRRDNVIVTYGPTNPTVNDVEGCSIVKHVECVNHVGAGDCFAAHLALALGYGFSLVDAAMLAHAAGRVYVQHPHNRPPHPCEIEEDLCGWSNEKTA
jgi:D-beta-D-heptose 7-phosphate kinase/D-beta-D-heptose 1-phosphate adenosyltransferase